MRYDCWRDFHGKWKKEKERKVVVLERDYGNWGDVVIFFLVAGCVACLSPVVFRSPWFLLVMLFMLRFSPRAASRITEG